MQEGFTQLYEWRQGNMVEIKYNAHKFNKISGRKLRGTKSLKTSFPEIIWSAISIGKISIFEYLRYNKYSYHELVFRISMIEAYLKVSNGKLQKSDIYLNLDPSEKGAISYYIGNVMTNLISTKFLGIKRILHYDLVKRSLLLSVSSNNKPDFVCQNYRGEWIILESKGRSGGFEKEAIVKAKTQLKSIKKINNSFPVMKAVIQSYYDSSKNLCLYIEDPEEFYKNSDVLKINEENIDEIYYKFIIDLFIQHEEQIIIIKLFEKEFYLIKFDELDIAVGLECKKINFNELKMRLNSLKTNWRMDDKEYHWGGNGVLVVCGLKWSLTNIGT
jgi:hypothetical protein